MDATKFTILAIVVILLPSVTLATEYIVGDASGWTIGYNYTQWAADKEFYVGDTLVFKYFPSMHNVFKISTGDAFMSCEKPDPRLALTTGNDVITLATPGKKWYICGVAQHCVQYNQKLAITVMEADAPVPAPSPFF